MTLAFNRVVLILVAMFACAAAAFAQSDRATTESRRDWQFFTQIEQPAASDAAWHDFVLGPAVFDKARVDLGDLRLYDAAGREVPYALRVRLARSERQAIDGREYNRTKLDDGSVEINLDLGEHAPEHNEVEIATDGRQFRRGARIDASADDSEWRVLVESANLLRFEHDGKLLEVRRLSYSPSRHRYLRVRVRPDPEVDKTPLELSSVKAYRSVDVAGEEFTVPLKLGAREAVMGDGGPGSAWILELPASAVPCEKLAVHVADSEFVRNYRVEAGGPPESRERFYPIAYGEWRRRAGEPAVAALIAPFGEQPCTRFRLVITDHRNPPLTLERVDAVGAARQIVFARSDELNWPLRLEFGNPKATAPNYDFARQLASKLDPAPARLTHADRQVNPDYLPPPKPLTERWPWLIYAVLSASAVVLTALLIQLARMAIAQHDARTGSHEPVST